MAEKHYVILIPGLGDNNRLMAWTTKFWKWQGLEPVVFRMGWADSESLKVKLAKLGKLIRQLAKKGKVSLVGTSAGGSAVLNAYLERREAIEKVVNLCGRLRTGNETGWRSFATRTASSAVFAQSVSLFEKREKELTKADKKKILCLRPKWGDELVPPNTASIAGANYAEIPCGEHTISICLALTFLSQPLIKFLKS